MVAYLFRVNSGLSVKTDVPREELEVRSQKIGTAFEIDLQHAQLEGMKSSPNSLLFLGDECPEPIDQSTNSNTECLDAIDQHFRNEAAYIVEHFGMVPKKSSFTYGQMFDEHKKDRELLVDALQRSECRLLEGPIRLDLRETCNADAFERFTLLAELCHTATGGSKWFGPLLKGSKSAYRLKIDVLGDFKSNPANSQRNLDWYHSQLNEIREEVLKDVWLGYMCSSHISGDLLFAHEQSSSLVELAEWWNEGTIEVRNNQLTKYNFPSSVMDSLQWAPHERLAEISVRLGDARLVFDDSLVSLLSGSNDYRNSKRSLYQWMEQLKEAMELRDSARSESISLAARGMAGMRESGFDADVAEIARFFCETEDLQGKKIVSQNCATSFVDAESLLDTADWKALRMLDEIASKALDQGIFQ